MRSDIVGLISGVFFDLFLRSVFTVALTALAGMGLLQAQGQTAPATPPHSTQGQQPPGGQQGGMSGGGNSTGGTFAAVYDAEKRPITAGGFVDVGPVIFEDITKAAGLETWQHVMGSPAKKLIIDADGSGVALVDYDNDGWLDIYFVNGSTF